MGLSNVVVMIPFCRTVEELVKVHDTMKEYGLERGKEELELFDAIVKNVSNIVIFVGNVVFICEKPLVLWENGMIHSDQKMAIEWKDGTGFYYLDGVNFEKELFSSPRETHIEDTDIV